ncbi:MAG: TolC family protein [Verrucomicrobiota bacterium]
MNNPRLPVAAVLAAALTALNLPAAAADRAESPAQTPTPVPAPASPSAAALIPSAPSPARTSIPAAAPAGTPATSAYIAGLVAGALQIHPKTAAARARTLAARQALDAIPLWEDPMISIGVMAAEKAMRRDDGDLAAGFEQTLPRPGLYRAEKNRAAAEAGMQQAEEGVTANELGLAIARLVIELALTDELIRLQSDEVEQVRILTGSALERSKNPDATAVESLRLESELALLVQNLEATARQRKQQAQALNLVLLRPPGAGWPEFSLPGRANVILSAATLRAEMERRNPKLLALRQAMEAAAAGTEAARQQGKPIVSVGVDSNTWSGGDFRSAMFTLKVSLPWFNRKSYQAETARRESLQLAARRDLEAELVEFSTQLSDLLTTVENHSRLAVSYQTEVIPRAGKSLEALQNAWISSKATLADVLDAQRLLLTARQSEKRATAARLAAVQQLTALSGAFANSSITPPSRP